MGRTCLTVDMLGNTETFEPRGYQRLNIFVLEWLRTHPADCETWHEIQQILRVIVVRGTVEVGLAEVVVWNQNKQENVNEQNTKHTIHRLP